jgi:hypothetical protein
MKNFLNIFAIACFCCFSLNAIAQNQAANNDKAINTSQKTPVKIIEYIPGKWTVQHVMKGKRDMAGRDTLGQNETLEFTRDGKYTRYNNTEKIDSGAYRINEEHSALYLSSGSNDTPSEFNIEFDKNGGMTLTKKTGDKMQQAISFVYKREPVETTSNRH